MRYNLLLKLLLIFFGVLLHVQAFSQSAGDYRSANGGGDWGLESSWEYYNGTSWVDPGAEGVPLSGDGVVTIRDGHTINTAGNRTVDQLTVESNAVLNVDAADALTIADGTGTDITINSGGRLTNGGSITLNGTGTVNGTYEHALDGGTVPAFSWDVASTCLISGTTDNAPAGLDQTFGNFEVDIDLIGSADLGLTGSSVFEGDFIVRNTGGNSNRLALSSVSDVTVTFNGNLEVLNTSEIRFSGNATTFDINGDLKHASSNSIELEGVFGIPAINLSGDIVLSDGVIAGNDGSDIASINFDGSTVQTYDNSGGGVVNDAVHFVIQDGAVLAIPDGSYINGGGDFTLSSGGELQIGSAAGIVGGTGSGNIRNGGSRAYANNATIVYNGSAAQTLGDGFPVLGDFSGNFVVDNSNGVSVNSNRTFSTLTLSNGSLIFDDYALAILDDHARSNGTLSGNSVSILQLEHTSTLSNAIHFASDGNSIAKVVMNGSGGSATLGSALTINDTLRINAGSLSLSASLDMAANAVVKPEGGTLNTNGNLVLNSTSNGTAGITEIGGTLNGNITMERYIPGGARSYRFFSPATGDFTYDQLIDEIHITGEGGSDNGFDETNTNNSSVFTYDETDTSGFNDRWAAPSAASDALNAGMGCRLFVRGNKQTQGDALIDGSNPTPEAVTLSYTGSPNTGTVSPSVTCDDNCAESNDAGGWNLVGNPYPCAIDWNDVNTTNLGTTYYVWDPVNENYQSYNSSGGTGGAEQYIASSQAFFVKSSASGPSMTFEESDKADVENITNYFRKAAKENEIKIRMQRMSGDSLYDEAYVTFHEQAADTFDAFDSHKLYGNHMSVYTINADTNRLVVNSNAADIDQEKVIPLAVFAGASDDYQLQFSGIQSLTKNWDVRLRDNMRNQEVELSEGTTYMAEIDNQNDSSYGEDRFVLVFENDMVTGHEDDRLSASDIRVFPNPHEGNALLYIDFQKHVDEAGAVRIYNSTGRIVQERSFSEAESRGTLGVETRLNAGMYYVKIRLDSGEQAVKKLVIR